MCSFDWVDQFKRFNEPSRKSEMGSKLEMGNVETIEISNYIRAPPT
jgi:hypothetical protein